MPVSPQQYPQMANMGIYLPCNENTGTTVKDYSGNGHDFTASNAAIWSTATNDGVSCLYPDNTYSATWATSSSADANFAAAVSFTLECWVKMDNFTADTTLVEHSSGARNDAWLFQAKTTNTIIAYLRDDGGDSVIPTTGALLTDVWYHLAVTVDRDTDLATMYLDGVVQGTPSDISAVGNVEPEDTVYLCDTRGQTAKLAGYVNNFVVWKYAKHDFGYTRAGIDL